MVLLNQVRLKNFATFADQELEFKPGLNVIVGETGSGKSLILEAIQQILGSRSDKKLIRHNCDFSLIEAEFAALNPSVAQFLNELGYPLENDKIFLKRIISKKDTSKSFINFSSTSANQLTLFSRQFIDLVGQFENQKLLSEEYQLELLDIFAKNQHLSTYKELYKNFIKLTVELTEKKSKLLSIQKREDYLKFQIEEIENSNLSEREEISLLEEKTKLLHMKNSEVHILELMELFQSSDSSLHSNIKRAVKVTQKISDTFLNEKLLDLESNLLDLIGHLGQYTQIPDDLDEKITSVIDRLDFYQKIRRKYGSSIQDILSELRLMQSELLSIKNLEQECALLCTNISHIKKELDILANKMSILRTSAAKQLEVLITSTIQDMNMLGATVNFKITSTPELSNTGYDKIQIFAEINPGEGFHLIKDIASGGELSRFLLAFRYTMSIKDSISIFLFDEIDTGLDGDTALKIGKILKSVSKNGQVIAITHLPQIAKFADSLIHVSKKIVSTGTENRTFSLACQVSGKKIQHTVEAMASI